MSKLIRKARKGFTLIELMIVVAIIGILAAIAIPNFLRFQLKSKSSEGKVNIAAIRTAEESFLAEFGRYVSAPVHPAVVPGAAKGVWTSPAVTPPAAYDELGWAPEGQVFFQYAVASSGSMLSISAAADIDADAVNQAWGYVKPNNTGGTTSPVHAECVDTGVGPNQDELSTVGPCDAGFGQSIF